MPDEFTVETNNGTLAVEDTGPPGTPVVLLHGAIANLRSWDRVISTLGSGLRAVSFDLPAHGQTRGGTLKFADLAAGLVALVDRLSLERPILVGHSFGGLAVVVAAGSHPSRFAGVMAIDPYLSNHWWARSSHGTQVCRGGLVSGA